MKDSNGSIKPRSIPRCRYRAELFIVITHSKRNHGGRPITVWSDDARTGLSKLLSVKFQGNRSLSPAAREREAEPEPALAGRDLENLRQNQ